MTNPLDIIKRLDVKQNVTIRVIDEPTGKVVQEHVGHNAATNSLLTGIAHYLMGDGVLNQGSDTLSSWVPQYISLGTMGLTSQESEIITVDGVEYTVPACLGYTPIAPEDATAEEKELNARLRFTEYLNQTPGFGADGYDNNSNNNREWFGLGYPYTLKPDNLRQDFYTWDGSAQDLNLSETPIAIISVTLFTGGVVNQDISDTSVERSVLPSTQYSVEDNILHLLQYSEEIPADSRLAVIYTFESADATNCELISAKIDNSGNIVPLTLRSQITYRDLVPEIQSEVPNTLDVIFSAFVSVGALKDYRSDNDYIYITEAGLWSKPNYNDSGDNGLLAGYRIMPSDDEVNILGAEITLTGTGEETYELVDQGGEPLSIISIDSITCDGMIIPKDDYEFQMTLEGTILTFNDSVPSVGSTIIVVYRSGDVSGTWKDMTIPENRQKVQQSIIRIGKGQVAQIIWKIQLGGLEQLNGLRYLYPSLYPEEVWTIV